MATNISNRLMKLQICNRNVSN